MLPFLLPETWKFVSPVSILLTRTLSLHLSPGENFHMQNWLKGEHQDLQQIAPEKLSETDMFRGWLALTDGTLTRQENVCKCVDFSFIPRARHGNRNMKYLRMRMTRTRHECEYSPPVSSLTNDWWRISASTKLSSWPRSPPRSCRRKRGRMRFVGSLQASAIGWPDIRSMNPLIRSSVLNTMLVRCVP